MAPLDLRNMFSTGRFSDFRVIAGDGRQYATHKIVVLSFPSLERLADLEASRLQLPEPQTVVQLMLRWMYGDEWQPEYQPTTTAEEMVRALIMIGDAATKYELADLQERVLTAIREQVFPRLTTAENALDVGARLCRSSLHGLVTADLLDRIREMLHQKATADADAPIRQSAPPISFSLAKAANKANKNQTQELVRQETRLPVLHCTCRDPLHRPRDPHDPLHEYAKFVQCDTCGAWWHVSCAGKIPDSAKNVMRWFLFEPNKDGRRFRNAENEPYCRVCDPDRRTD